MIIDAGCLTADTDIECWMVDTSYIHKKTTTLMCGCLRIYQDGVNFLFMDFVKNKHPRHLRGAGA